MNRIIWNTIISFSLLTGLAFNGAGPSYALFPFVMGALAIYVITRPDSALGKWILELF